MALCPTCGQSVPEPSPPIVLRLIEDDGTHRLWLAFRGMNMTRFRTSSDCTLDRVEQVAALSLLG